MTGRLDGKLALITGAGGDLGGATASRFAAEGAAVVVHDVDGDAARQRVDDIASDTFGTVDVLVNCAGTSRAADSKDKAAGPLGLSDADRDRLLSVHLDGAFFCTRAMPVPGQRRELGRHRAVAVAQRRPRDRLTTTPGDVTHMVLANTGSFDDTFDVIVVGSGGAALIRTLSFSSQ